MKKTIICIFLCLYCFSGISYAGIRTEEITVEDLKFPTLNRIQREKVDLFFNSLSTMSLKRPQYYDLKVYQTRVKDQNPRGSCPAFAFVGALEAAYIRSYGLHSNNENTDGINKYSKYGIANDCSKICVLPECFENCEFDLSEEYFIHTAISQQHSYNPSLNFENLDSFCAWSFPVRDVIDGVATFVAGGMTLPRENFAPYFGNANNNLFSYGTFHGHNDLVNILLNAGVLDNSDGVPVCNPNMSQRNVDDHEYNESYIPMEARKNAKYGVTDLVIFDSTYTQNIANLEKALFSKHEVSVALGLGSLDCAEGAGNRYNNGDAREFADDGNLICKYPVRVCSDPSVNCQGIRERYNAAGNYSEDGHQMLLIGYDQVNQRFLLKNSWGAHNPFIWVPYTFMRQKSWGGLIIKSVRDPGLQAPNESMLIGKWNVNHNGNKGELVIRRTRDLIKDAPSGSYSEINQHTLVRMGTFYDSNRKPHLVTGFIDANQGDLQIYVDFSQAEDSPWGIDSSIALQGQHFRVRLFNAEDDDFTFGNIASGYTEWNNQKWGVILTRENTIIEHISADHASFQKDNWKGKFNLYYLDGNRAEFDVSSVLSTITDGPKGSYWDFYGVGAKYYPLLFGSPRSFGYNQGVYSKRIQNMFFEEDLLHEDLFYHTRQNGVISGLGVIGIRDDIDNNDFRGTNTGKGDGGGNSGCFIGSLNCF